MKKINIILIAIICTVTLAFLGIYIFVKNKGKQASDTEQTLTDLENLNKVDSTSDSENMSSVDSNPDADIANTFSDRIIVTIGSVSGTTGSTVTVPIRFDTMTEEGVGSCNFSIEYDDTKVEVVEVTPGDIIENRTLNLDYAIADSKGMISFLLASDNENDAITKAGVFVNIKFKIKDNTPKGDCGLTSGSGAGFGDPSINRIDAEFKDGQITII